MTTDPTQMPSIWHLIFIYLLIGVMISLINKSWSHIQDDGARKLPGMRWLQGLFSIFWWLPSLMMQFWRSGGRV